MLKPNLDSVKEFLIKEYGFLSDIMEDAKSCSTLDLSIRAIQVSNQPRLDSLVKADLSSYEDIKTPIIVRKLGSDFILIDGYHRLSLQIQKKSDSIFCIIVN